MNRSSGFKGVIWMVPTQSDRCPKGVRTETHTNKNSVKTPKDDRHPKYTGLRIKPMT